MNNFIQDRNRAIDRLKKLMEHELDETTTVLGVWSLNWAIRHLEGLPEHWVAADAEGKPL